jgi:hypothetical protein
LDEFCSVIGFERFTSLIDFTKQMQNTQQSSARRAALRAIAVGCIGLAPKLSAQPSATSVLATSAEEVPYVQTPMHVVRRMLQLADVERNDVVWDLGSGDGRIVIEAAKRGAQAVGYEIDPRLIRESIVNARRARVAARTKFVERDLFTLNFATPSVVTMYLLPEFNMKLRPRLLEQMRPGSRIVSHEWDMGDWQPDETLVYPSPAKPHGTSKEHKVFLWVVPARIAGRWRISIDGRDAFVAEIAQQHQKIAMQSDTMSIAWAALRGRTLRFAIRDRAKLREYQGTIAADTRTIRGNHWFAQRLN